MRVAEGFTLGELVEFARRKFAPGYEVSSDGLSCFSGVIEAARSHSVCLVDSGRRAVEKPIFEWVNTTLENIETPMSSAYRHFHGKHAPRYLPKFQYRFNYRVHFVGMLTRPTHVPLRPRGCRTSGSFWLSHMCNRKLR